MGRTGPSTAGEPKAAIKATDTEIHAQTTFDRESSPYAQEANISVLNLCFHWLPVVFRFSD